MLKPQRDYQAFQLVFNKRYSNRWQGLASMVYSWSNGTAQRTMRQDNNLMGPMLTDDNWMSTVNYTVNNMDGVLPFVPKWEVKASGSYTVPKVEMDLGLRFRFHTGRALWRHHHPVGESPRRGHSRGRHEPHRLDHDPNLSAGAAPSRLPAREGLHAQKGRVAPHHPGHLQHLQQRQRHQRRVLRHVGPDHGHQ